MTIPGGASSGTVTVSFPTSVVVWRNVVVSSESARFWATVRAFNGLGRSPPSAVGSQSATVSYVVVNVDWMAVGS
ncbi:MAG: hypothetical protein ACRDGS_11825 [Chloroflexota bacterium]